MARGRGTIVTAVALSLPLAIGAWFALRFGLPSITANPMLFALQCAGVALLLGPFLAIEAYLFVALRRPA